MTLDIKNPASWLKSDLKELHSASVQFDEALNNNQAIAKQLDAAGASNAAKAYHEPEHHEAILELHKVLDYRIRNENPNIDDMFDKAPSKERLAFAKRYGSVETVLQEQNKLLEIE